MRILTFIKRIRTPRNQRHFLEYRPFLKKTADNQFVYKNKKRIKNHPLNELTPLFSGKSVFLVGSGPSIAQQNLSLIEKQPLLLMNGAITLTKSHRISPTAYMVVDKSFIRNHPESLDIITAGTPCIFTAGVIRQVLDISPDFFDTHPLYFIEKATKRYEQLAVSIDELPSEFFIKQEEIACSLDITKGFAEGGTVMYAAAQLMLFLRAKKVTLVGFDLGNADQPRFYETHKNKVKSGIKKAIENRIIPSFKLLATQCKQQNIKLTNTSHISSMPYDIIPFDNILMPERDKPDYE